MHNIDFPRMVSHSSISLHTCMMFDVSPDQKTDDMNDIESRTRLSAVTVA